MKKIIILAFTFNLASCGTNRTSVDAKSHPSNSSDFVMEKVGRDLQWLSIHPNGEDWLITECSTSLTPQGDCYVLKFNYLTKQLQRFDLPAGYLYNWARYSPLGNYIVMGRSRHNDGTAKNFRSSAENSEIVLMKADGSDFNVLPIPKGIKLGPTISGDETAIAYWRAGTLKFADPRLMTSDFTLWEYDIRSAREAPFFRAETFLSGGNIQYISKNELLIGSYAPTKVVHSLNDYFKQNGYSEVYRLTRGAEHAPAPAYSSIGNVREPSMDASGNVYLEGAPAHLGSSFAKIDQEGQFTYWQIPPNLAVSGLRQVLVDPNGKYLAFSYVAEGFRQAQHRLGFAVLDVLTSTWSPVNVPELRTANVISVHINADAKR